VKKYLSVFSKRLSESTLACMVAMTQGNILVLTLGHWLKALQVGSIAAFATIVFIFFDKQELTKNKFVMAGALGFFTAIVDLASHPTHFGGPTTEALVTGMGAGLLCLAMSNIWGNK
jgi:uncharacterized membrane protein YjjP (DUF1212 family)